LIQLSLLQRLVAALVLPLLLPLLSAAVASSMRLQQQTPDQQLWRLYRYCSCCCY
jgi:ABC-type transport system involved in cytochrome c biogenesis permease component